MVARAQFESLRSLDAASISGSYASVGSTFSNQVRAMRLVNNTQGDMIFTDDTNDANGKWFVPSGSFVLWDIQANISPYDDKFPMAKGTQISVKQETAPVSGKVYVEVLY